jgi:hypothetical protein
MEYHQPAFRPPVTSPKEWVSELSLGWSLQSVADYPRGYRIGMGLSLLCNGQVCRSEFFFGLRKQEERVLIPGRACGSLSGHRKDLLAAMASQR